MTTFRWGILATGSIADAMAYALRTVPEAELVAVASRSQATADAFGERWGIPRRYADYAQLAADPQVDVVYIATPHNLHAANMQLCLAAGKHVLCEKPLTLNAAQAAAAAESAQRHGRFLMEAVWMRFLPAVEQVRRWVADGAIGAVRLIQADFCFHRPFDPTHRLYDPALGGGALLDLGIYPLSLATMLLGFPQAVHGQAQIGRTGVDEVNAITLTYADGALAQLTASMTLDRPREAFVLGSRGAIRLHDPFFRPDRLTLHQYGRAPEEHHIPFHANGYPHEVEEVHACLRAGLTESPRLPLAETVRLLALMDELRAQWGVVYPDEAVGR